METEDQRRRASGHPRHEPVARRAPGRVTLLGAGPGDPELLTVKGLKALQGASLVLYDALVSEEILALAPASAERVFVGKEASRHAMPQEAIIELMLRLAREGRSLVRLKGGDGYIFGRGGEEALALARHGVPFEVIPGLSAAQGAGASAGIPLTHRDHAAALVFATGHLRQDGRGVDLDWTALARPRQTLVIYMGVGTLPLICRELIAHGLPADTPAAIVERATMSDERCLTGTVASLPEVARHSGVRTPALIVVGTVVGLRPLLAPARPAAGPGVEGEVGT